LKNISIKKCRHDLAERETSCADGACPICLMDTVVKQRLIIMDWERASDARMRKYRLLLTENKKLRNRIKNLDLFDPNQP
jgi:hypothetical protein